MTITLKLNDGTSIPALAWGNGSGTQGKNVDKSVEAGTFAVKAGFKHIDTAQLYQTECAVAPAIEAGGQKRSDIYITSKISDSKSDPESIRATVKQSISELGSIPNLYLIHNPFVPAEGQIASFWTALEDLVLDGTLKGCSIGVSNYRVQDMEEVLGVARIKPAVNQLEYHPFLLNHLDPLLKLQEKHGIVTEAYGPLTPLLRHKTGSTLRPLLEKIAATIRSETGQSEDEVDATSVLLRWTIQKGVVAVTTSGREKNIQKLAATEGVRELTKDEMEGIEAEGRKVHYRHYREHMTKDNPSPDLPEDVSA